MDILMILIFVTGGFALGWSAFYFCFIINNNDDETSVAPATKGKHKLTRIGTVVVPSLNQPTRRLMLSLLESSLIDKLPLGATNEDNICFVPVEGNRQKFVAYYVGSN